MQKHLDIELDSRLWYRIDWLNLFLVFCLSMIGLVAVFSATYTSERAFSPLFVKQCFGVLFGVAIYAVFFLLNRRALVWWGSLLYVVTIFLLLFTLLRGSVGMGAQRWINLGFFKFQPSELAKLFFPAMFTRLLGIENVSQWRWKRLALLLFFLGSSVFLVLKQPDLGTALIILFSGLVLLWVAGVGKRFFVFGLLGVLCMAPLGWRVLKPYQKQRVVVFLGGGGKQKERYQVEQSRIAVGSGGFVGKGYLQGTQSRLNFLPENHTDFIFAVIGEEWGLFGALCVVLSFFLLFLSALNRIASLSHKAYQLLALGLILPTFFSAFINMAMVLGVLPIVGIPLPFVTYGLTHLLIDFASMGWYNNIISRGPWTTL